MFKSLATVARRSSGRIPALVVLPQRFTGTTPSTGTTISELVLDKTCEVDEALRICKAFATQAYDESILLSLNLGLDPRKPNQMVRGMAPVPHGSGKKIVLAVFASGEKAIDAKNAGADIVGGEELVQEVLAGKIEFNRCIATPDMMKHLAKVARVLGPRGLMPNPKLGTVTTDITGAVQSSRQGQIEYRCDKNGIVHCAVGKASWPTSMLKENLNAFVKAIFEAKPSGAKGAYFRGAYVGGNKMAAKLNIREYPFKQAV